MSLLGRLGGTLRSGAGRIIGVLSSMPPMVSLLARTLQRNHYDLLHKVFAIGGHRWYKEYVFSRAQESTMAALYADENKFYRDLILADQDRFQKLVRSDAGRLIKDLLFSDNDAVLFEVLGRDSAAIKRLLLADQSKRLKSLLSEDDSAVLKSLYGPGSKTLRALLLDDDAKRLRRFLFGDGFAELESLFRAEGHGALRHLLLMGDSRFVKEVLSENNGKLLYTLLFDHALIDEIAQLSRARAHVHFEEAWGQLEPIVDGHAPGIESRLDKQRRLLLSAGKIWDHLTLVVADDGAARLRDGTLAFADRGALWTLMHEILINEDYYADLQTPSPRILDCGAHFGMGLYYFMTRHPGARVTAFEPDPANFAVLSENVSRNGFSSVELLPYALSGEDGARTLFRSDKYSMASSLSDRRKHFGESLQPVEVECRRLSQYLREPVDFLKLDIEGEEDRVLEECIGALENAHYLFCEYHQGEGLKGDRLPKILQLLSDHGFDVHVGKSHSFQAKTKHRPMTFVDDAYSAVIYAKNRNWPPADIPPSAR